LDGKGIGARMPRLEDQRYLRGLSQFVADVAFPNMLHAAFLRSPHAHANILGIRKPAGSVGRAFAADDLAGVQRIRSVASLPGYKGSDWPVLARGKVRHVGESVAMALGRTPAEAEELAAAIEVEYVPLKPAVTMAEAMAPDAPLVHEHWSDNILVEAKIDAGDFEAARAAAHVVSHRFRMNRQVPLTLEGRGAGRCAGFKTDTNR
jgi:aerobic carbon-monoxide dehydrogenase large subunit